MVEKGCSYCRKRFEGKRKDARYCSAACRQAAYRARQPRANMDEVTAKRLATKRGKSYQGVCRHCGRRFWMDGTQTAQVYCDAACRQAAYRARKKLARFTEEIEFLEKCLGM